MHSHRWRMGAAAAALIAVWGLTVAHASRAQSQDTGRSRDGGDAITDNARRLVEEGRRVFRYETFGDEAFWGDTLKLHRAIEGARLGGVGPGVSPRTALAVGLKVDVDALPPQVTSALRSGQVNLDDPATTLALLKANAVVGVTGHFDAGGSLSSM